MKIKMKFVIVIIVFVAITLSGCKWLNKILGGINDPTNKIVQTLDGAISTLNSQSANWQEVLNGLLKDLPADVSVTLRGDVSNLLQRTVAATGGEIRCDVDFFRIRVQQALEQIKAKFLGTPLSPLEPHLCQTVPLAIDMSFKPDQRNNIQFFGYDFDMTRIEVFLVSAGSEINVSQYLDQPTHYHLTLNLGGSGVQLNRNSQRFILRWNGRNISTIAVIQAAPKICETEYHEFTPGKITFIPPRAGKGDTDFKGHGPSVNCSVTLINYGDHINAKIYMDAVETKRDWTEAQGSCEFEIYRADPDKTIEKIISSNMSGFHYTDTNHETDLFSGNGCISSYNFTGDTDDDEAGTLTKVTVAFNSIRVQLKEKGDCISTRMLQMLNTQKGISPDLLKQIKVMETRAVKPVRILNP
jgi:hypothetical protein